MAIKSPLFVRVVAADRGRGFMLLIGFDAKIVQSTARKLVTLSALTRDGLNAIIAAAEQEFNASEVRDVTAEGIKRQLRSLFNEPQPSKV